jgi:hypothetical protein
LLDRVGDRVFLDGGGRGGSLLDFHGWTQTALGSGGRGSRRACVRPRFAVCIAWLGGSLALPSGRSNGYATMIDQPFGH